jgi:toxin ParE1/3/4
MTRRVFLTDDASGDLEELYDYITSHDAPGKADYVLDQIEKAFSSLSEYPERGTYPKELLAVGLREYREIFFKPYRFIYRVMAENVYVMVVADGRRDMRTLLQRRLLQARLDRDVFHTVE